MPRVGDLEIDQDLRFEERELRIERFAWCLMLLIVMAAILGLFGTGVLDRSDAYGTGMSLRYSRFERMSSPTMLEVTVAPTTLQNGLVSIWLSREYAASFEITSVTPPPESAFSAEDRVIYIFRAESDAPAKIIFHLRVSEGTFGPVAARMGVLSGGEAGFWQFVWP
jgi:hypothetical protein